MKKNEVIELFENCLNQLERRTDRSPMRSQLVYYIFDDFKDFTEEFVTILFTKNILSVPNLFDVLNDLALKKNKDINTLIENRLLEKIEMIFEKSEEKDIVYVIEVIRKWSEETNVFSNELLNQIEQLYQEKLNNCENLLLKNYLGSSTAILNEKEGDPCRRCLYKTYEEWMKLNRI